MKQHTKWWERVYTEFIKNKTRREISETTWRSCLKWMQSEAATLALYHGTDFDDAALFELAQIINEELDSN